MCSRVGHAVGKIQRRVCRSSLDPKWSHLERAIFGNCCVTLNFLESIDALAAEWLCKESVVQADIRRGEGSLAFEMLTCPAVSARACLRTHAMQWDVSRVFVRPGSCVSAPICSDGDA